MKLYSMLTKVIIKIEIYLLNFLVFFVETFKMN